MSRALELHRLNAGFTSHDQCDFSKLADRAKPLVSTSKNWGGGCIDIYFPVLFKDTIT